MNLSSQVDDSVVDALAAAVKRRYGDLAHRFYKLKARWLGVDKIQYWDRNAPLPFAKDESISWEQSVKTVLDAYGSFSKEFQEIGRRFLKIPGLTYRRARANKAALFVPEPAACRILTCC